MAVWNRTSLEPEGKRWRCHICGNTVILTPSYFGDATCPSCGWLLWPNPPPDADTIAAYRELAASGVKLSIDASSGSWKVDLSGTSVTNRTMKLLLKLGSIIELNLADTPFDDVAALSLSDMQSLEVLELANTRIGDKSLQAIKKLRRLEVLGLHETAITDSGLEHLNELPSLWCLDLDHTSITGRLFEQTGCLESVEWLFLGHRQVDDDGLISLQHANALQQLWIHNACTSEEGIQRFELIRSACVVHRRPKY
ncbi:MAG: hypothetical protein AB8G99_13115 [Planctomycetaceae bacterium]